MFGNPPRMMVQWSMERGKTKTYLRDGRAPVPKSEATSRVMSANRGKNTKPELTLRGALRSIGLTGYRIHWRSAPGRPDISFPGRKVAIFVNGCFWHSCPYCRLPLPKSNTEYWRAKFERNSERDARKKDALEEDGWHVIIVWECEIRRNPLDCAERIARVVTGIHNEV